MVATTLDAGRHYEEQGPPAPLAVVVLNFEVDFRERNGKQVVADKVILGKIGDPQYRQEMWISRLSGERCDDPRLWHELIKPAYDAWKSGEEIAQQGTPLAVLGTIAPRVIQQYRMLNIHNVEQLGAVQDGDLPRLGLGGQRNRDLARKYLEAANSETSKIAAKQREQDEQIAKQAAEIEELKALLADKKKAATQKAAA